MADSERVLTAYLSGRRVGWFRQSAGVIDLEFDDQWRSVSQRLELSMSLPKSRRVHTGPHAENYLWGLLPDNTAVLERWGRQFAANPRNAMALLEHVGLDTAGAVQLSTRDEPEFSAPGSLEPIDEIQIGNHLRHLRDDPDGWFLPSTGEGNFSLAGAQAKFALALKSGAWAVPLGSAATTHIIKPGITGLSRQDIVEHLCLAAARILALDASESRVIDFDGESAIVLTRYDRVIADDTVRRVHQEDLMQASGLHPRLKYQNEGGPGILSSVSLLRESVIRARTTEAAQRFFEANMYNWIISGTDAHAKNYSLLHDASGTTLAPFYDIASTLPYRELSPRKVSLAMSVDGRYRMWEVTPQSWLREAATVGLDPDWANDRLRELVSRVGDAFAEATLRSALEPDDLHFANEFMSLIAERAQTIAKSLKPTAPAPTTPGAAVGRRASAASATEPRDQLRRKDAQLPGNGGRFTKKPETVGPTGIEPMTSTV